MEDFGNEVTRFYSLQRDYSLSRALESYDSYINELEKSVVANLETEEEKQHGKI